MNLSSMMFMEANHELFRNTQHIWLRDVLINLFDCDASFYTTVASNLSVKCFAHTEVYKHINPLFGDKQNDWSQSHIDDNKSTRVKKMKTKITLMSRFCCI